MSRHTFIEWSGRFDGSLDRLIGYLGSLIEWAEDSPLYEFPSGIMLTEFQQVPPKKLVKQQPFRKRREFKRQWARNRLAAALNEKWPGVFKVRKRGQYVIITAVDSLHLRKDSVRLKRRTNLPGFPGWRQFRTMHLIAADPKSGVEFLLSVGHAPAGVQNGKRWQVNLGAAANRLGHRSWGRMNTRHVAKGRIAVPTGDANLALNSEVWEKWLEETLQARIRPDYRLASHAGNRDIDFIGVAGEAEIVRSQTIPLRLPVGYDHRPKIASIKA